MEQGHYIFDYFSEDRKIENIEMSIGGIHNIENACAAISICLHVGLSVSDIISGLKSFKGVKRRFERIIDGEFVFIDDYAHHPTEIMSVYNSLKNLFIEKKIVAVFQPHLFSRTKDFYKDFAKSLDGFDEVLLLPVYPARELPISGVSTKLILDEMENENARLVDKDELLNYIEEKNFDVLVTLGAGDIDKLVNPIKEILK
ncbi:MAG: glutamate ligase domain-containing protein [Hyphomicrobiales bacterium]